MTTGKAKQMDDFPFHSIRDFFPKIEKKHSFIDVDTGKLTISFFKQSALKQLLTEGLLCLKLFSCHSSISMKPFECSSRMAKRFDQRAKFLTAWPLEGQIQCYLCNHNLSKNRLLQ